MIDFRDVTLELTCGLLKQFPKNRMPQVALAGRSNVGKSSLINCLVGRKSLARTSSAPGKTITVNFYNIAKKFYLVDLPGYGYAKRPPEEKAKWSELTDGYFTTQQPGAVIQLIDIKAGATADDRLILDYLVRTGIPFFVVATKIDKLNKTEFAAQLAALHEVPELKDITVIPFSALSGAGRDEIRTKILNITEKA